MNRISGGRSSPPQYSTKKCQFYKPNKNGGTICQYCPLMIMQCKLQGIAICAKIESNTKCSSESQGTDRQGRMEGAPEQEPFHPLPSAVSFTKDLLFALDQEIEQSRLGRRHNIVWPSLYTSGNFLGSFERFFTIQQHEKYQLTC